ncbi:hypothetical protein J2Z60_001818 [Lactobacillus colini]|uniref:DUF3592 domain-containing protein n=1 Tax=Lactobacillus colini TaxID=1819254 RepID=A0ABS4MG10_9LACO|nr:hypothetical protein [Lactobacillus colini]MBP2058630.1 hypothetical protein [Lactobacillus colini]
MLDKINFGIGVITFIFMIATYVFTLAFNKGYFDVDTFVLEEDRGHFRITFSFMNGTSTVIKVKEVIFRDNANNKIPILDFNPEKYDDALRTEKARKYDEEHRNDVAYFTGMNPYKIKPIKLHPESKPTVIPFLVSSGTSKDLKFYLDKKPSSVELVFTRRVFIGVRFLIFPIFKRSTLFEINM